MNNCFLLNLLIILIVLTINLSIFVLFTLDTPLKIPYAVFTFEYTTHADSNPFQKSEQLPNYYHFYKKYIKKVATKATFERERDTDTKSLYTGFNSDISASYLKTLIIKYHIFIISQFKIFDALTEVFL
jgi:hypothetical protein